MVAAYKRVVPVAESDHVLHVPIPGLWHFCVLVYWCMGVCIAQLLGYMGVRLGRRLAELGVEFLVKLHNPFDPYCHNLVALNAL